MALDWSKDVSFSGLRKKQGKVNTGYPEKTYINLAVEDQQTIDTRKAAILGVVLLVIVVLFVKFGVFDFIDRVNVKQGELNSVQQTISELDGQLADYDDVKAEFDAYEAVMLVSGDSAVSADDALALVDSQVRPAAKVVSVSFDGSSLKLNLADTTLERVGDLVGSLYEQPLVKDVSISTASSQEAANGVVTVLNITLQAGEGA